MQLIVISGLSGSGKSVALNVLEDSSYYVVDNLPATLLQETVAFLRGAGNDLVAVTVDARSGASLTDVPLAITKLRTTGVDVKLLFLDSNDNTLIRRFSETRRRHPLSDGNQTLSECIRRERELVAPLADLGHKIDTSDLAPNALRQWVKDILAMRGVGMTLILESFGFKQGIPLSADMVFDVRCIPNPYYDPALRPLSGLDQPVVDFLTRDGTAQKMCADIGDYLDRWLDCFIRDNRAYLTVAIGCTGGQHRSVYFVERLAARFKSRGPLLTRHRQLRLLAALH